ncbi:hypothetical protein NLG97_g3101 [Lecanicillium saksenae]|uniref:Uncharacterized protein n=1 Tax=Lecanicillium saksenae TaxID=468837 RepID=A0ACC1R1Q5_9HYPO|nr:hypothetical protein NLG97_g3101 [Lecanicillium saksenae]
MVRDVNEAVTKAPPQNTSEWTIDAAGRLSRDLKGTELVVRSTELVNNGNFQLDLLAGFDTPLTTKELRIRQEAAWWLTRERFPVVGITLGVSKAFFEPIVTIDAAQRWVTQTCLNEDNTTGEAMLLAQCRHTSDTTRLSIVLEPIRGSRACVLNNSHTVIDHVGYDIVYVFLSYLANDRCKNGLKDVFVPEDAAQLVRRLPQSLSKAYYSQIAAPTEAERQEATSIQRKAQDRWNLNSIGIPIHTEYQTRQSRMHNKQISFEEVNFRAALALAKKEGVSLTSLFFAAMTAGIHQRYSNGGEDGAHLVFSGNARRWVKTQGETGEPPVALSIIPGAMWLDRACLDSELDSQAGLLALAKKIDAAQRVDLASAHIIGVYDELAPAVAKATLEGQSQPAVFPPYCRPTLTSQGDLSARDTSLSTGCDTGRSPMRLTRWTSGGRNTDSTVCFALYSFKKELLCGLLFDERFFDEDEMMQLLYIVAGRFRRMVGNAGQQNSTSCASL